jgi:hypothetical protein
LAATRAHRVGSGSSRRAHACTGTITVARTGTVTVAVTAATRTRGRRGSGSRRGAVTTNKQTKSTYHQRDSRRNINVPRITVLRSGRSYTSKDGSSANKRSNECDHCVRRLKVLTKNEVWTRKKSALIFLPGKRSVYSVKEGDLHKPTLVRLVREDREERKNEPRESGGRTVSRESTRLRRERQRKRGREWEGGKMGERGLGEARK